MNLQTYFSKESKMAENEEIYSIIIDSRTRLSGTPENFKVRFNPVVSRIKTIKLESVFLPFNFNNVTVLYGNSLQFVHNWNGGTLSTSITIPIGFYNINELLTALNDAFTERYALLPGNPASPFTFTLASIPNRVLLNYNSTNFPTAADITFTPFPASAATGVASNYLYTMLGLDSVSPTTFTFPNDGNTTFVRTLANSVSVQLPISYVMIFIQGLPAKVISSGQIASQFYIDISGANLQGKIIALPNSYKANHDYYNSVDVKNDFFNFQELRVYITDNYGQTLDEQNVVDWHFSFKVTTHNNSSLTGMVVIEEHKRRKYTEYE